MHTLFQGLVAAVISAGVALLVLMVTVRTQNKGIRQQIAVQQESLRKQLEVQERSVAEQLQVQRHENTRNRELAIVGNLLTILKNWRDVYQKGGMSSRKFDNYFKTEHSKIDVELEELRINGDSSTDVAIDCFKSLAYRMWRLTLESKQRRAGLTTLVSAGYLEQFLVAHLTRYARMNVPERVRMNEFLTSALDDFQELPLNLWRRKYMEEISPTPLTRHIADRLDPLRGRTR